MYRRLEPVVWGAFSLPAIAIVVFLFFAPFLLSAISSLQRDGQWTLANYQKAITFYGKDIAYTIGISFFSLFLVLLISIIVSGILRIHTHRLVEFLFKIPLFVPFVVVGHAWRVFLAPHGTLNSVLAQVGLVNLDNPPSLAFTWLGISIALAWKNMALAVLLIMGAFRGVDEAYLEAARNFGASTFHQIKDILVPMSSASLAVASVLMFTSMMASFSIPLMMGSGGGLQMVMIDVYYQITYQQDLGVANALGVMSYLLASGAAIYYLRSITEAR